MSKLNILGNKSSVNDLVGLLWKYLYYAVSGDEIAKLVYLSFRKVGCSGPRGTSIIDAKSRERNAYQINSLSNVGFEVKQD